MKKILSLSITLILLLLTFATASASTSSINSDTTKSTVRKPNMGYKYNKLHHLKADGTTSKLYKPKVVTDTAKRKA